MLVRLEHAPPRTRTHPHIHAHACNAGTHWCHRFLKAEIPAEISMAGLAFTAVSTVWSRYFSSGRREISVEGRGFFLQLKKKKYKKNWLFPLVPATRARRSRTRRQNTLRAARNCPFLPGGARLRPRGAPEGHGSPRVRGPGRSGWCTAPRGGRRGTDQFPAPGHAVSYRAVSYRPRRPGRCGRAASLAQSAGAARPGQALAANRGGAAAEPRRGRRR